DERAAGFHVPVQDRERCRLVGPRAEVHRAQAEHADLAAGLRVSAGHAVFHAARVGAGGVSKSNDGGAGGEAGTVRGDGDGGGGTGGGGGGEGGGGGAPAGGEGDAGGGGQAEPRPAGGAVAGCFAAIERREQVGQVGRVDAGAAVGDGDCGLVIGPGAGQADL